MEEYYNLKFDYEVKCSDGSIKVIKGHSCLDAIKNAWNEIKHSTPKYIRCVTPFYLELFGGNWEEI